MSSPSNTQNASREAMTSSASSDGPRKQKFRSFCDSCSASKVKCDQGLPTCARCVNLGIKCNYSPSRRMGKPAAIHRDSSAKSQQAETSKKRQLLSPPPSSVCRHEQVTFDAQNPTPDAFFFDSTDLMQRQWQPSTLSPASNLGDIDDSDNPPVFPYSIDTKQFDKSPDHALTP